MGTGHLKLSGRKPDDSNCKVTHLLHEQLWRSFHPQSRGCDHQQRALRCTTYGHSCSDHEYEGGTMVVHTRLRVASHPCWYYQFYRWWIPSVSGSFSALYSLESRAGQGICFPRRIIPCWCRPLLMCIQILPKEISTWARDLLRTAISTLKMRLICPLLPAEILFNSLQETKWLSTNLSKDNDTESSISVQCKTPRFEVRN